MSYAIGLAVALTLLWLGFSGMFKPLILVLGVISIAISTTLAARMGIIDRESSPYHRIFSFIRYAPWLFMEILKSNWIVVKAILLPSLDIHPTLVKVRTTCKSDLAKVTFANSITLTPGTVTLRVEDDFMLVHGLYESNAQPEDFVEMDRRCSLAGDSKSIRKGH